MHWSKIPLTRLVVPFAMGIIAGIEWPVIYAAATCAGATVIIAVALYFKLWRPVVRGVMGLMLMGLCGYSLAVAHTDRLFEGHLSNTSLAEEEVLLAEVTQPLQPTERSLKTVVKVMQHLTDGKWKPVHGRVLLYISKQSDIEIDPGQIIAFRAQIRETNSPGNPHEFNYKRYLGFHKIHYQAYVQPNSILVTTAVHHSIRYSAMAVQAGLVKVYEKLGIRGNELHVLSALVLGKRNEIDDVLKTAYSSAGAMHVLAVSGLHVGIIYLILQFLLKSLGRSRKQRAVKVVLILILLWGYAFITGLSPSVLRATTMFSIIALGNALKRQSNVFNSIAASAFVLLLADPYIIMEVGFQLSYSAVLGIVIMYDRIYNMLSFRYWIMDKIWSITVLSIAAQLGTFPLGLLYFHQFPVLFLFSNLIVIPLATIILMGGLVVLGLAWVPWVGLLLANVLSYIVQALNEMVMWLEGVPGSLVTYINMSVAGTILLYIALIMFSIWLVRSRVQFLVVSMILVAALLSLGLIQDLQRGDQKYFTVYKSGKYEMLDFVNGKAHVCVASQPLLKNKKQLLFFAQNDWIHHGLGEPEYIGINDLSKKVMTTGMFGAERGRVKFDETSIQVVTPQNRNINPADNDIIILSGFKYFPKRLFTYLNNDQFIIVTNTNRFRMSPDILNNLNVWDIRELGGVQVPG